MTAGSAARIRGSRGRFSSRSRKIFTDLALARGDGRYPRLMRALGGVKLLILDDWALEPLGPEQRHDVLLSKTATAAAQP
jgi:DNA replication protein DnaC